MGGRQPKNATWFELSVAASLETNPYSVSETSMNLTDYYVDVNPPPYASDLTNAGYPASVDIIAQKGDSRYNISCKFSQTEEAVLSIRSPAFQDVFLEFVPVLKVERVLGYRMGFALATNMRLTQSVEELFKCSSLKLMSELAERVKKRGESKYKSRFNDNLFDEETLLSIVQRMVVLRFGVRDLESLHEANRDFKQAFESFSKSLVRTPKVGSKLIEIRQCDVIFNCHSQIHEKCTEVVIDDLFCHFGDLKAISRRLREQAIGLDEAAIVMASGVLSQYLSEENFVLLGEISKLKAYNILTKAFNEHRLLGFPEHLGFFIVPGTEDLLIFDYKRLSSELRKTQDQNFRYRPDKVSHLQKLGLGPKALEEVTKWALRLGFGLKIDASEIAIEEKMNSDKKPQKFGVCLFS